MFRNLCQTLRENTECCTFLFPSHRWWTVTRVRVKKNLTTADLSRQTLRNTLKSNLITGVCFQDSIRQSQSMAAPGSHAETAGRLPATSHHQKRLAQVHQRECVYVNIIIYLQWNIADWLFRPLRVTDDVISRFLSDFYENSALMLEEEGAVIVGLLVGLNVIDANLCVKGEDLDSQVCHWRGEIFWY